jgi:hypothetical protein
MVSEATRQESATSAWSQSNSPEVFAVVQQISSHINRDRMQEIVDKAKSLEIEDHRLMVDLLGMVRSYYSSLYKRPHDPCLQVAGETLSTSEECR